MKKGFIAGSIRRGKGKNRGFHERLRAMDLGLKDNPLLRSLKATGDAVFLIDPESTRVLYANFIGAIRLGYTVKEMIGMPIHKFVSLYQSVAVSRKYLLSVTEEDTIRTEAQHRKQNGNFIDVETILTKTFFGGYSYIISISRDISARKHVEGAYNRLLIFNESILDTVGAGIIRLDKAFEIVYVNKAMVDILGTPPPKT